MQAIKILSMLTCNIPEIDMRVFARKFRATVISTLWSAEMYAFMIMFQSAMHRWITQ